MIVPLVGLLFFVLGWKQRARRSLGNERLTAQLIDGYSEKKYIIKVVAILMAIALLIVSASNPRKPIKEQATKGNGIDIMIALDVSKSMLAADEQPTRLGKAKELIYKLIEQLHDNRIGLVVFAGRAYLQVPLTNDLAAMKMFVDNANPSLINWQGTEIGDALTLCDNSLDTKEKKYKAAILITDGEDQDTKALDAAKTLANNGVIVHTIGVGEESGVPIIDSGTNGYKKDASGNTVITKLNTTLLQQIANATGGSYHHLDNSEAVSNDLSEILDSMEKKGIINAGGTVEYESYYPIFLGLAIVLLVIELFVSERKQKNSLSKGTLVAIAMLFFVVPVLSQNNNTIIKGNESYRKGDFKEAQDEYEKVLERGSQNDVAIFNYANALYRQEQYAAAIKQMDLLIGHTSDASLKAKAWYNKGLAEVRQQLFEQALVSFKRALLLNNNDEDARDNLQMVMNELERQGKGTIKQANKTQSNPDKRFSKKQLEGQLDKLREKEQLLRSEVQEKRYKQEGNNNKDW